jgi:gliding motility-associated-like protein
MNWGAMAIFTEDRRFSLRKPSPQSIMHERMIRFISALTGLLFVLAAQAQQLPANIQVKGNLEGALIRSRASCANDAGTLRFGPFTGQSNSVTNKRVFLCFNDSLNVLHNNDFNLSGDPDGFTPPGIRYALYDCPPTISGPKLSDILNDRCLNKTSPIIVNGQPVPQSRGIWITTDGSPSGNISLFNRGLYQSAYAGGKPVSFWFAPITIDDFGRLAYEADPATGEAGPCVNVGRDAAFEIIYLNAIQAGNILTSLNGQPCQGSFVVRGGLPEYDSLTNYTISLRLVSNPSITGKVISPSRPGHLDTVRYFVPQPGTYEVLVEDGKSCEARFTLNMAGCEAVTFSLPLLNALPGDTICLPLRVKDFDKVGALEMSFSWDTTVLGFIQARNFNPDMKGLGTGSISTSGGKLVLSWLDANLSGGISLPDNAELFSFCFRVKGSFGSSSPVRILPSIIPEETVGTTDPRPLGYILNSGQVNISANTLFLDLQQDSVGCQGGASGAFTIRVASGVPPYNISWQSLPPLITDSGTGTIASSGGSLTISGKLAGQYRVQVRDAQTPNFNTISDTIEILEPPIIAVQLEEKNPSCYNATDGSIKALLLIDAVPVSNPGPQFTFKWNVPGVSTAQLSNIPAGPYSVTVTNAAGCSSQASTNLSQPAAIVLNPVITSATCSGVSNGRIALSASGGFVSNSGRYSFTWAGRAQERGLVSTLNNLLPGTYCVTVSDDNGCSIERCFTVGATKVLSIDAVITDASCNGTCDGVITVTGRSTLPALPNTFTWSGSLGGNPANTSNSSTIRNLCAGVFVVTMRDSDPAGCQVTDTLILEEPAPLDVALVERINETCVIGQDGRLAVGVSGGTGPYRYFWSNGQRDSVASNLSAGVYTLRVIDANECENAQFEGTITAPAPPVIISLINDTLNCSTDVNGSLSIVANQGGAPIVSINWSNGGSGARIDKLSPGAYEVVVLAADGCQAVDTAFVVAPEPIRLNAVTVQSPRCPGEANGQATINAGGGTRPYRYIWATPTKNDTTLFPLRPGLSAGVYAFTVTDANNCPGIRDTVQVNDPPRIQVSYRDTLPVSCYEGVCNGAITAIGGYANGAGGRFTFTWSNGEMASRISSFRPVQLCRGPNALIVVDSNACTFLDTVNIPSPPEISIAFTGEPVSCNRGRDGKISARVSGGTPGYNYLWLQNSLGLPSVSGLAAGNYTLRVTDARGCPKESSFTVTQPDELKIAIDPAGTNNARCNGGQDGRISVKVNTNDKINLLGASPFTWSNGIAPGNSATARQLAAGSYSVTVTDVKGCQASLSYEILQPRPINAVIRPPAEPRCFGEPTTLRIDSISGGNGATFLDYVFNINNSGISFPPNQAATIFAGEVIVTIEDPLGCTFSDTLFVNQPDELKVFFDPAEIVVELGDSLTVLEPIITNSLPIDSFLWTPRLGLSAANIENPRISGLLDNQSFTLRVRDINGCIATGSIFVELDRNRNVYIPNIFSPNGDGRNDELRVFACNGVTQVNYAQVYDRWGGLVWESRGLSPDCLSGAPLWDGKLRGKEAPAGVYVYIIEVKFLDGVTLLYRGDTALIR